MDVVLIKVRACPMFPPVRFFSSFKLSPALSAFGAGCVVVLEEAAWFVCVITLLSLSLGQSLRE